MLRILVVPTIRLGHNGITNVILNYYKYLNRSEFHYDFFISNGAEQWVRSTIKSFGGNIYDSPSRNKKPIRYAKYLKRILTENHYDIIHIHGNSGTMALELLIAKKANIKKRIAHTHSSTNKYKILHYILKKSMNNNATDLIASSDKAATWSFIYNYIVLKNGIEVDKFLFNSKIRQEYRKQLGIENKFVIGHIGDMTPLKNHDFLLDVFNEIYKKNSDSVLLLIGDGKNKPRIQKKIEMLSLTNSIKILGNRNDVSSILQAMDVFVFPSKNEGLGIVTIEAQAAGLKCIVSDAVPLETKITNNIEYLPLELPASEWAEAILKYKKGYERKNLRNEVSINGFNIKDTVKILENLYR